MPKLSSSYEVVVIGAGFAGIGTAIRLLQSGVDDFVILERENRVGGTWRDNTYPGCACDIPSLLYSYSFAQNPNWSQGYPGGQEILEYIDGLIERFDLKRYILFGTTVAGLTFDEPTGTWAVEVDDDDVAYRARSVVMATGPLPTPNFPDVPGIEDYRGDKIHSARWDHDYDFTGKRVAVIGTGPTGVQIVPELNKRAGHVKVFQRTPGWVIPRLQYTTPNAAKKLFAAVPSSQTLARKAVFYGHEILALALVWLSPVTTLFEALSRLQLRTQVKDPALRSKLTPRFRAGCKRILVTSDFYPALQKPNCALITQPIANLVPEGIQTSDQSIHEVDAIVFATGFEVYDSGTPFPVVGLEGRVLAAEWAGGAFAYKSVNISGYPNFHVTFGPNSGPGHNSALFHIELQIDYLVRAITVLRDKGLRYLDVGARAQLSFNEDIQSRLTKTTWNSGCKSWYLTKEGLNWSRYPGSARRYARQMAHLILGDYRAVR